MFQFLICQSQCKSLEVAAHYSMTTECTENPTQKLKVALFVLGFHTASLFPAALISTSLTTKKQIKLWASSAVQIKDRVVVDASMPQSFPTQDWWRTNWRFLVLAHSQVSGILPGPCTEHWQLFHISQGLYVGTSWKTRCVCPSLCKSSFFLVHVEGQVLNCTEKLAQPGEVKPWDRERAKGD